MFALIMTLEGQAKKAIPAAEYEAMLSGIAREDSAAFERFYRSTDRTLYTYILSLTRNHHDAQDVMMDTYLKVRANAHRYVPQGKPLAWVFTIARNLVRSRQREAARETLYGDVTEVELAFPATDTQDDALALREAMTVLSEEERQIVLLHAVSGMKHRELSELLELPLSTVLSKYARALAKLKKALTSHSKEVTDHA
ncbi:MAG TPA: RNA polymerase sigma factor [Candidatus Galloscillospira stercoripullorum]|nr:RNA polymerase sigma factor [Candidatus Galloscillospira stercoripullorum]